MLMGWRIVLQMSLIPGLLFGLVIWSLLRTVPVNNFSDSSLTEYWRSVVDLLRNGKLILVLIFAAGFAGGQSAILTFLPIYLDENMGASSVTIGFYLSLAQVGGIVSQPLLGYMSDRFGRKMILAPSLAILGATFIALITVSPGWMFGIVILIMGAFLFPLMAILLAAAVDLVAIDSQATTVSLVFGAAILVSAFAPALAGVLADGIATEAAFVFAGGLVLSTSLLSGLTRWHPVEYSG
jgi:predicted MFS family arabinose efflux permease